MSHYLGPLGSGGVVRVRTGRTTADAPAVGDWTPDNLNAAEIAANKVPEDFILDATMWRSVRLAINYAGTKNGAETITVVPLVAIKDANGTNGRRWARLPAIVVGAGADMATDLADVDGHLCAFRITALALGTATSVAVDATSGVRKPSDNG